MAWGLWPALSPGHHRLQVPPSCKIPIVSHSSGDSGSARSQGRVAGWLAGLARLSHTSPLTRASGWPMQIPESATSCAHPHVQLPGSLPILLLIAWHFEVIHPVGLWSWCDCLGFNGVLLLLHQNTEAQASPPSTSVWEMGDAWFKLLLWLPRPLGPCLPCFLVSPYPSHPVPQKLCHICSLFLAVLFSF